MLQQEADAPSIGATPAGRVEQFATPAATVAEGEPVTNDATPGSAMSDDDLPVAKMHDAVVLGDLKRNLASICKFLECGQRNAIRLNCLYIHCFGKARRPKPAPVS